MILLNLVNLIFNIYLCMSLNQFSNVDTNLMNKMKADDNDNWTYTSANSVDNFVNENNNEDHNGNDNDDGHEIDLRSTSRQVNTVLV